VLEELLQCGGLRTTTRRLPAWGYFRRKRCAATAKAVSENEADGPPHRTPCRVVIRPAAPAGRWDQLDWKPPCLLARQ